MVLATNLDGHYKLEADGTDSVGTLGTATGTTPTFTTGKLGNCASFASASSQYLETAAFVGGASWSFSIWYNATTLPSSHSPICRDLVSGSNRCWNLSISATQATLYGWNSSGTFYQTTSTNHNMSTGTWYHWAGVWNAATTTMYLYRNGILFTSVAITGNAQNTSTKLSLGRDGSGASYMNGKVDEASVWSRALSADEISQVYSSGRANAYPYTDTPTLYGSIAYYKFDESSGNPADATGAGNTLTNNNTVGYAAAKINNGADYGGSNTNKDFSIPTTFPDLNSNTPFSFSFWLKTSVSSTTAQFIATRCNGSAFSQYDILINDSAVTRPNLMISISPANSGTNQLYVGSNINSINDGTWHHYVITYSGSRAPSGFKIYQDGVSQTVSTVINTLSSNGPTGVGGAIGSRTSTFGSYWSGNMDEFGFWNRELSAGDVTTLYNGGLGFAYPFVASAIFTKNILGTRQAVNRASTY